MYDTVSGVFREVPPEVLEPRRWQRSRESVDLRTGEVTKKFTVTANGLLLTLHAGGRLQFERSLPKAYRGENVTDLLPPQVADALAIVDGEIAAELGTDALESVATTLPVRVDYPRSVDLGTEAMVLRTLEKYAETEMPYKGRPVVGQSHSVTWSAGDIKLKAYSKFQETKGDPRARGLLRIEPGVFRARAFRRLLGLPNVRQPMTLLDVLTPDLHRAVHSKFEVRLRGDLMTAKEIGDLDLAREMVALFGPRRTASLVGWAVLFALYGVVSRADILTVDLGSVETRYRILADYRSFRGHLLAKGYTLSEAGTEVADVEDIVHRIARAA